MLLLDQDGNRQQDWHIHFAFGCLDPTCISNCFRVGEKLELFNGNPITEFAQLIRRPFNILAKDILVLNRDCTYTPEVLDALRATTGDARIVTANSDELSSVVKELTLGEVISFRMGRPLWVRAALNSPSGPGYRGSSDESAKLRRAFQGWAVICNHIVFHSLRKRIEGKPQYVQKTYDIRERSDELVSYVLGSRAAVRGLPFVRVQPYKLDAILTKPVGILFPKPSSSASASRKYKVTERFRRKTAGMVGVTPRRIKAVQKKEGKKIYRRHFYSQSSETISAEISRDIENFSAFGAARQYDPLAVSAWALHILFWLRFAYSTASFLDTNRAEARKLLVEANNDLDRQAVAEAFSDLRNKGVKAEKADGTTTAVSDIDLMGLHEAILIAFFADIDPGPLKDHSPHSQEIQTAVFSLARWFGRFYRQRIGHLTPEIAGKYLLLMNNSAMPNQEVHNRKVAAGLATITSFLSPAGLDIFQRTVRAAVSDNTDFSVHASAAYHTSGPKRRRLKNRLARLGATRLADHLPSPVAVPAGRLLIPGDYSDKWFLKFNDLLESPKKSSLSMTYLRLAIDP